MGPTTRKAAAGTGIVALIAALVATTIMFTIMKRKPTSPGPPHQAAPRAGLDGGLRPQVRQLARAPITTWSRGFTASGEVSFSRDAAKLAIDLLLVITVDSFCEILPIISRWLFCSLIS